MTTAKQIAEKVQLAHIAQRTWSKLTVAERIATLTPFYKNLLSHKKELAELTTESIRMPVSIRNLIEIDPAFDSFKWYIENSEKYLLPEMTFEDDSTIHKVYYEPTGVAAVISPWNFPFCNFIWSVIPNLIVGNSIVFKHSIQCEATEHKLEEITKASNLPDGILSYVYGDGTVGEALANANVDLISYTGSTKVGYHLYEIAAKKMIKIVLELGGSAPGIVCEDANIDEAIESIYFGRFVHSGQVCDGLKRLIVHETRFAAVIKKLTECLATKKIGDPNDPTTHIGPLISNQSVQFLDNQVKDAIVKGAKLILGGTSFTNEYGSFYQPTLLTNITTDMRIWKEEVFGPVLPIISFNTESQAISLANDTPYGLGAYIFTEDKEKAKRVATQIQSGMVSINTASYLNPNNPWGGYKQSGLGRGNGKFGLHDLCRIKVIASEK